MKHWLYILTTGLLLASCNSISDKASFYEWLNSGDSGLVKTKTIEDLQISIKYMPPELQAMNNLEEDATDEDFVKLTSEYSDQLSFLVSFKSTIEGKDILYKNISTTEQYDQRIYELGFMFGEMIQLELPSEQKQSPSLFHLERAYGTSKTSNIYLVFAKPDQEYDQVSLIYIDKIFGTGVSRYTFKKSDMDDIPRITI